MFHDEVLPRIKALAGVENISQVQELKFVGIGESDFHESLDKALAQIDDLEIGYCARLGEVDLRLIGAEESIAAGRQLAVENFGEFLVSDAGYEGADDDDPGHPRFRRRHGRPRP